MAKTRMVTRKKTPAKRDDSSRVAQKLIARLDRAMAEKDDYDFFDEIGVLDMRWNGVPLEHWPEPLALFGELYSLYMPVTREGIWKYLSTQEGRGFERAMAACRTIRARRAVAYLGAVKKLYPRQRVPVNDAKRFDVVAKLEEHAVETTSREPLGRLDVKYADALPQMAEALRAWIRAHRQEVDDALRRVSPPPARFQPSVVRIDKSIAKVIKKIETAGNEAASARARFRAAAERAGIRQWSEKPDARYDRFLADLGKLSVDQWSIVLERARTNTSAYAKAARDAFDFFPRVRYVQEHDRPDFLRAYEKWKTARNQAAKRLVRLPEQLVVKGEAIAFRSAAATLLQRAALAFFLYDWLPLHPGGKARGQAIAVGGFAPFVGLVMTPLGATRRPSRR
jgi:hypothetical protein